MTGSNPLLYFSESTGNSRVLITGSRDWDNYDLIAATLQHLWDNCGYVYLGHGNARRGVDRIADREGNRIGFKVSRFDADWDKYGKSAGMIRNQEMLKTFDPEIVVAFKIYGRSSGTENMIEIAHAAGKPVVTIAPDGNLMEDLCF